MRTDAGPSQRLADAFASGAADQRALVMPFLVCGYPDPQTFVALARGCAEAGADVLEIGVPFSDPIMDGPVIQAATTEVLRRGLHTGDALELIGRAAEESGIPVVAMTYYNLIFRYELERFAATLAAGGGSGVIVPDLSVEDSDEWRAAAGAHGLATVFLAAQTSTDERLERIARCSSGFVYAASLLGVTGLREDVNTGARALVDRIKRHASVPVALGIGISTTEHAREVAPFADGVIVGSAIVKMIDLAGDPVRRVRTFVSELRDAAVR